jgi:hypothetical protein
MVLPSIRRWLSRFASAKRNRPRRRPLRFRPRCERFEDRVVPSFIAWTGQVDTSWNNKENWNPAKVPDEFDTAYFGGGYYSPMCVVDMDASVGGIQIDSSWGGIINVAARLSVTGNFNMAGGTSFGGKGAVSIAGSASTWTAGEIDLGPGGFANNGTLTIGPAGMLLELLGPGTLTNNGTINDATSGVLQYGGAVLNNAGTFDITADGTFGGAVADGNAITNTGMLEKTGGTGQFEIDCIFNNTGGTIDSESGLLTLNGEDGTINGGALDAGVSGSTTAILDLYGQSSESYSGTITGSGSGTVALRSGTLTIGAAGATFDFPGKLFQWSYGTIDVSSGGTLTNAGVININASSGANLLGSDTAGGTLANSGTINEAGTSSLVLQNNATLSNAGTFDFTGDASVAENFVGNGASTLRNTGTLEKTGGTGESKITCIFVNTNAAITVQTGTLVLGDLGDQSALSGGSFTVSRGAALDLAGDGSTPLATVTYTGTFTGTGAGTVAQDGVLKVGAGGTTFNMAGNLFQWIVGPEAGSQIDVSNGNFTNIGTMNIAPDVVIGNTILFHGLEGAGSLINKKSIISRAGLSLDDGATLNNAKGATLLILDGSIAGPGISTANPGGTIVNAGTLTFKDPNPNGGDVTAANFSNTGTVQVLRGSMQISGSSHGAPPLVFSNTGTVQVLSGSLIISATVTQVSGSTLTAGTWIVKHAGTSTSTLSIVDADTNATIPLATIGSKAKVTLSGPGTAFPNLSGLSAILAGGSFTLAGGQSFTTTASLTNNGSLTLSPGSILTVDGSFTQGSSGTLTVQMGGTSSSPTLGQLFSTSGTVALGGNLKVTATVAPAVDSIFMVLDNEDSSAVSGSFAGLPEGATFTAAGGGATMTFQITYLGGSGNDVVITRIS